MKGDLRKSTLRKGQFTGWRLGVEASLRRIFFSYMLLYFSGNILAYVVGVILYTNAFLALVDICAYLYIRIASRKVYDLIYAIIINVIISCKWSSQSKVN